MSIPTIYVKGTKKQANERLASGLHVEGHIYEICGRIAIRLANASDGAVIKFWEKMSGDSPIAKSYGNWRPAKNKIV
jgi:hypothetical protein